MKALVITPEFESTLQDVAVDLQTRDPVVALFVAMPLLEMALDALVKGGAVSVGGAPLSLEELRSSAARFQKMIDDERARKKSWLRRLVDRFC